MLKLEQNRTRFENLDLDPNFGTSSKMLRFCSNFGKKKSFSELFLHTKYEQNWSTFDDAQNFEPNFFENAEKGVIQQPRGQDFDHF